MQVLSRNPELFLMQTVFALRESVSGASHGHTRNSADYVWLVVVFGKARLRTFGGVGLGTCQQRSLEGRQCDQRVEQDSLKRKLPSSRSRLFVTYELRKKALAILQTRTLNNRLKISVSAFIIRHTW